jgi:hypothetical protein
MKKRQIKYKKQVAASALSGQVLSKKSKRISAPAKFNAANYASAISFIVNAEEEETRMMVAASGSLAKQ